MSVSFGMKYRYQRVGGFVFNFEQILLQAQKGKLPEDNILYFMIYAKRFYKNIGFKDKAQKLDHLIRLWEYWLREKRKAIEKKSEWWSNSYLSALERSITYKYIRFDEQDDYDLKMIALKNNGKYYHDYVVNLITMKQYELFFEILSMIWLCIYSDLSESEVKRLIEGLTYRQESESEDELIIKPKVEEIVDESIDYKTVRKRPRPIERTHVCFLKILKVMKPILDTFRNNFFKETKFYTKLYNAQIYTFSLLMVAEKILGESYPQLKEILTYAFRTIKKSVQFRFIEHLRGRGVRDTLLSDLYLKFVNNLDSMVRDLFGLTENILSEIEKLGKREALRKFSGSDKTAEVEYNLTREIRPEEKDRLVGLRIDYDEVWAVLEMVKAGESSLREVSVDCSPYTISSKELPPITLLIGKTGSGKTVHGLNLIRVLLKDGYCVYDISMNVERPYEMIFPIMPLDEKLYKNEFKRLKLQQMVPEKLPMYILIPYYKSPQLPKYVPSCAKLVTIPLHTLANKQYAYDLLFTKIPESEVVELVDLILKTQADESWDLDTLRHFLKKLLEEKKPSIWIKEKITEDFEYEKLYEIDKRVIKSALKYLVPSSDIISSGKAKTVLNFDEITKPGVFVTVYLGHIPDRVFCFAFITWLFYSLCEYKARHPEKKVSIFINEAQTIAPSQALVGGVYSKQKFSLSADIASSVLQWRGMGFKAIVNTQMQSQLKQQLITQAGLVIVFHTTNKADLDYAFGDIVNPEMRENLKLLVQNKFFFDEHMCVYKWGSERVDILVSAIPPFAIERQNINPFELYRKKYKTDVVKLDELIKQIEEDKKRTFIETMKDEIGTTIKLKEMGKKIVGIDPEKELVISAEELEKRVAIPKGKTLVSKKALKSMVKLKPDETIVKKEDAKKLEEIGKDKVLIDRRVYETLVGEKLPKPIFTPFSPVKQALADITMALFVGCKSDVKFHVARHVDEVDLPYVVLQDMLDAVGLPVRYEHIMGHWRILIREHPIISKVIRRSKRVTGRGRKGVTVWKFKEDVREEVLKMLESDYKNRLLTTCAIELYQKFPELPWSEEVVERYNEYFKKYKIKVSEPSQENNSKSQERNQETISEVEEKTT